MTFVEAITPKELYLKVQVSQEEYKQYLEAAQKTGIGLREILVEAKEHGLVTLEVATGSYGLVDQFQQALKAIQQPA